MKVYGTGGIDAIRTYTSQIKKEKAEFKDKEHGQIQADRLELSPEARKIQSYKGELDKLPAVREELVVSLKQKIGDGSYRPDSEKIAAGIIEERQLEKVR